MRNNKARKTSKIFIGKEKSGLQAGNFDILPSLLSSSEINATTNGMNSNKIVRGVTSRNHGSKIPGPVCSKSGVKITQG